MSSTTPLFWKALLIATLFTNGHGFVPSSTTTTQTTSRRRHLPKSWLGRHHVQVQWQVQARPKLIVIDDSRRQRASSWTVLASSTASDPDMTSIDEDLTIDDNVKPSALELPPANKFDMETALFCSGLAFDSYIEPAPNSSRWERGVSFYETVKSGCRVPFFSNGNSVK